MKKFLLSFFALCAVAGMSAQTYTDITPDKFKFREMTQKNYDDFWDEFNKCDHSPAGERVIALAGDEACTDGYAYFYYTADATPNANTQIVKVDGIGNVLQFGTNLSAWNWGGCYFIPAQNGLSGLIRTTIVFRYLYVDNGGTKHNNPNLYIGIRNAAGSGNDTAFGKDLTDLQTTSKAGQWYKLVIEYNDPHSIRVNFGQLLWSDCLQIAQIKFEEMTDLPAGYESKTTIINGTPEELGIVSYEVNISDIDYATFYGDDTNALIIPSGIEAYICKTDLVNNVVNLSQISDGIIPAATPVLLYSEKQGTYYFKESALAGTSIKDGDNHLQGSATPVDLKGSEANYYFLSKNGTVAVFKKIANDATVTSAAHKAYLEIAKDKSTAPALRIGESKGDVSNLNKVIIETNEEDTAIYNVYGQKVNENYNGIVISNGKKYIQR